MVTGERWSMRARHGTHDWVSNMGSGVQIKTNYSIEQEVIVRV